jgi:hypothetical protein
MVTSELIQDNNQFGVDFLAIAGMPQGCLGLRTIRGCLATPARNENPDRFRPAP